MAMKIAHPTRSSTRCSAFLWMLSSVDSLMKTSMKNLTTMKLYPSMNSTIPTTGMTFMKVQPPSLIPLVHRIRKGERNLARKSTDRQVPNYAYKPKGEDPEGYFVKKIHSVIRWGVANANDVNYGLRVFEGWLAQAQKYVAKEEFYYAVCITRALLSDVLTCHLLWHHEYPKQMARVRKLERAVSEVYYQCLSFSKDKDFNWIDLCLHLLQKEKESYPFNSKGEAGFDVEDYIEKVIALLPDEKVKQYRDAHPTDKQLLEKPIPVCLPDKIR